MLVVYLRRDEMAVAQSTASRVNTNLVTIEVTCLI